MPRARTAPWTGRVLRSLTAAAFCFATPARADVPPTNAHDDEPPQGVAPAPDVPPAAPATPDDHAASTANPASSIPEEPAPRFDDKTHFSLSWVRLPGAEDCMTAKQLSRAVERRLRRPALGAPSETDVAIEGFVEKTDAGTFHALLTITNRRGRLVGKRELERPECREMDAALELAVALMIDPDAAFSPTAIPSPARRRDQPPPATVRTPPRAARPGWRGTFTAGVALGFGSLPHLADEAWIIAGVTPPRLFPIELGARLSRDQTVSVQDVRVAFSRSTFELSLCPLDVHVSVFRLGACAGTEVGALTAAGVVNGALVQERSVLADLTARGHLGVLFLRRFVVAVIPGIGVPLIRDSFEYRRDEGNSTQNFRVFRLPVVRGEVGIGLGVELK